MARSSAPGLLISFLVLLAGLLLAFTVGRYPISVGELFAVLAAKLTGHAPDVPPAVENVIWHVRGPRVLAASLVGAALAVAGTAFQGLFRNPLVSPDILGASSGAALGAVLGIFVSLGVFAIQALAFAAGSSLWLPYTRSDRPFGRGILSWSWCSPASSSGRCWAQVSA